MNQEQLDELAKALDHERKRLRAEAIAKQFSPAVRDSSLCQALAGAEAGMEDWQALLAGWVEEQWILHKAKEELVDARLLAEETSSSSPAASST